MALSASDLQSMYEGPVPAEMLPGPKAPIADRPLDELLEDLAQEVRECRAEWKSIRYTCGQIRTARRTARDRGLHTYRRADAEKTVRLERSRLTSKIFCYARARRHCAEYAAEIARRFPETKAA